MDAAASAGGCPNAAEKLQMVPVQRPGASLGDAPASGGRGASVPGKVSASRPRRTPVPRPRHHPRPQPGRCTWGSPAQRHVRVTFQLLHQLFLCWLLQDVPAKWGEGAQSCLESRTPGPSRRASEQSMWGRLVRAPCGGSHQTCTGNVAGLGTRDSDPSSGCLHGALKSLGERPSTLTAGAGRILPARAQPTPGERSGCPELGCPWDDQHRSVPGRTFPRPPMGSPGD